MYVADQHSVDQQQQHRADPYRHKTLALDTAEHLAASRSYIDDQSKDNAKEKMKWIIAYVAPSGNNSF